MSDAAYKWLDAKRTDAWAAHFAAKDAYIAVMDDVDVPSDRKQELAREFDRTRARAVTIGKLCQEWTEEHWGPTDVPPTFCPSMRRDQRLQGEQCVYPAGHEGEHRYLPTDGPSFPRHPVVADGR